MRSKIDGFFAESGRWHDEKAALRTVLLSGGLEEQWKWRQPCYTHEGKNVAMIAPYVKHVALAFFQGVLLVDGAGLLVAPGKDSQSVRHLRFTSVGEIEELTAVISSYVAEAMAHASAGSVVEFPAKDQLKLPDELVERFVDVDGLEEAFMALTPGRQRGLVLHISGAKQSATRSSRVEKNIDRILAGKGIHDCICGKSARLPRCDGSHAR